MLTAEQNRLLTEVEGDAPMGQFMRERHWIPCARSESLEKPFSKEDLLARVARLLA